MFHVKLHDRYCLKPKGQSMLVKDSNYKPGIMTASSSKNCSSPIPPFCSQGIAQQIRSEMENGGRFTYQNSTIQIFLSMVDLPPLQITLQCTLDGMRDRIRVGLFEDNGGLHRVWTGQFRDDSLLQLVQRCVAPGTDMFAFRWEGVVGCWNGLVCMGKTVDVLGQRRMEVWRSVYEELVLLHQQASFRVSVMVMQVKLKVSKNSRGWVTATGKSLTSPSGHDTLDTALNSSFLFHLQQ